MEVISTFCQNMNEAIRIKKGSVHQLRSCIMIWFYNPISGNAQIMINEAEGSLYTYKFMLNIDDEFEKTSASNFAETFNCDIEDLPINYTSSIRFNNVWNREAIFVHASFVNTNSFGVLGQSGEFYPKPSKCIDLMVIVLRYGLSYHMTVWYHNDINLQDLLLN